MKDSFEVGELNCVNWIDGKRNIADFLTQWNTILSRNLNEMLVTGIFGNKPVLWDQKGRLLWGCNFIDITVPF